MAQSEQMSLRLSIQNAQVIPSVLPLIKEGINHLNWPFFPLMKCLINEPHPSAWGLKEYWLKSMPCKVLLVNNMPRDSICRTFLIASQTPLTSGINGLSMWFMVADWLHRLLRAPTFMCQSDSGISSHKLSMAWPNAKNVFVLTVCMQMNVWSCLCVWLLTSGRCAKVPGASFSSHFWFVYWGSPGPPVARVTFCRHSDSNFSVCPFLVHPTLFWWLKNDCEPRKLSSIPLFITSVVCPLSSFLVPRVLNLIYCRSSNCLPRIPPSLAFPNESIVPRPTRGLLHWLSGRLDLRVKPLIVFSPSLTARDTWWICHNIHLWHGKGRSLRTFQNIHGQMRTSLKCDQASANSCFNG